MFKQYQEIVRQYKKLSIQRERKLITSAKKGNKLAQNELLLHLTGFFIYRIQTTLYSSIIEQYGEDTFSINVDVSSNNVDTVVSNKSLKPHFTVMPNPVNEYQDMVSLMFKGSESADAMLTIFDCIGNVIFKDDYYLQINKYDDRYIKFGKWDLKNLYGRKVAPGTYLAVMKIRTKDGRIEILRINIGVKGN